MKVKCPADNCNFSNVYPIPGQAKTGLKDHIFLKHPENRLELYKKVNDLVCPKKK